MAKSNLVRFGFGILYLVASSINFLFALITPEIYRAWADSALIPFYRNFMLSVSTEQLIFVLLLVAFCEFIMGLLILGKGISVKVGFVAAILFHLIITPWGYWSFPNLILALVLVYLSRKDFNSTLFHVFYSKFR